MVLQVNENVKKTKTNLISTSLRLPVFPQKESSFFVYFPYYNVTSDADYTISVEGANRKYWFSHRTLYITEKNLPKRQVVGHLSCGIPSYTEIRCMKRNRNHPNPRWIQYLLFLHERINLKPRVSDFPVSFQFCLISNNSEDIPFVEWELQH